VPPGPLIAIWGMETAFGAYMGNQNTVSAVATLAYDCRRPEFFTEQLIAALKLVDKGVLSSSSRGAMHGEVGQTQFLPKNVFLYGADGDGGGINLNSKADANLASTANFSGATAGGHAGYSPGQPNFGGSSGLERGERLPAGAGPSWATRSTETWKQCLATSRRTSLTTSRCGCVWHRRGGDRGDVRGSRSGRGSSGLWMVLFGGHVCLCCPHLLSSHGRKISRCDDEGPSA
jgi:hypothetical protein